METPQHKVYKYKHIIVVHGIGDQAPNETALGFMNEFIRALPEGEGRKLTVYNLIESVDGLRLPEGVSKYKDMEQRGGRPRSFQPAYIVYSDPKAVPACVNVIGFSEVYWQPIARKFIKENEGPPVPVFTWARSIATRLLGPGYLLEGWRDAIENLETMLRLMGRLATLAKKKRAFDAVTTDFLADVQMYAESDEIRQEINQQFFRVAARIEEFAKKTGDSIRSRCNRKDPLLEDLAQFDQFQSRQIYVVSHSEGTVVAYNSLIQAAMVGEGPDAHAADEEFDRANNAYQEIYRQSPSRWLPLISGLVTFGSPLDKHYLIWRTRFRKHWLVKDHWMEEKEPAKIPWLNFYDYNDPVAYGIKELLTPEVPGLRPDAQRIFDCTDQGFQRYPIPGKAHIDYWTDADIHRQIIGMMKLVSDPAKPPRSRPWVELIPLVGDIPAYLLIRGLTFLVGLYFLNRFLHIGAFEFLETSETLKAAHATIVAQPFGPHYLVNYATWLLVPVGAMKLAVEAEKAWEWWSPWIRWILAAGWFGIAVVIAVHVHTEKAESSVSDILGYATGIFATVLVWKLHTTIHRGLTQLWRYTKAL